MAADFNGDGGRTSPSPTSTAARSPCSCATPGNNGFASEAAAIPVGASPEGIEAADFNGDGYPDIAVAVLGTNTVNVLLRNPGGGFTAEAPIPVGAGALGLATADFDADGRPDLAVTSNTAGTVTALLRQAGGGFAADGAPLAAPGANGVAAGDFNGDGKPDLAASNDQANTLSVFLNTTTPAAPGPPAAARGTPASARPGQVGRGARRLGQGAHQVPGRQGAARRQHDEVRPAHRRGQRPDGLACIDTTQGPHRADVGRGHGREEDPDGRVLRRHLPGQAVGAQEEAQEARGADHRPRDEGSRSRARSARR